MDQPAKVNGMNSKLPKADEKLDLHLGTEHFYPPCRDQSTPWIEVTTSVRYEAIVDFSFEIDGSVGPFPGLELSPSVTTAQFKMRKEFIENYTGTWPVKVLIKATLRGTEVTETATLTLYDTRNMVADWVDITLNPNSVQLPAEGQIAIVWAPCQFFDENNVQLPAVEIDWDLSLNPSVGGVVLDKVIHVTHQAHSPIVNVHVVGPNGVEGDAVLTITR